MEHDFQVLGVRGVWLKPGGRMKVKLPLIILVLSLISGACSVSELSAFFGKYPETSGSLLFQDNFSDPSSGWDRIRTEQGMTDYDGESYRVVVNTPNADYWANPGLNFTDVSVEVDAAKINGPDDNNLGLLCRYQNRENFYFLIISSDGYYGIGKVEDGNQVLIEPEQMYPSAVILEGNQNNHLRAVCDGNQLTLYVNGIKVAETEDQSFLEGDVGLIVGTFDQPGVDVVFDNLIVTVP